MSNPGDYYPRDDDFEQPTFTPLESFGNDIGLATSIGEAVLELARYLEDEYGDEVDSQVYITSLIRQGQFPSEVDFEESCPRTQDKMRLILFDQLLPLYEVSHSDSPQAIATFTDTVVKVIVGETTHDPADCEVNLWHLSKECGDICPIYGMIRSTLKMSFAESRNRQMHSGEISDDFLMSQARGIGNRLHALCEYEVLDEDEMSSRLWVRD